MATVQHSSSAGDSSEWGGFRQVALECSGLALLTVLLLAPFSGKAFHIDDPIYVRVAEQIQADPWDAYGFEMNWFGVKDPVHRVDRNPPVLSYYLAAVMTFMGKSEVALHLALIPAAIGVVLGTYLLARRCDAQPLFAALCTLASPFLLISATQVMCETMMTCFWVWSVLFWVRGHQDGRWSSIAASALLISLALMTKFQAVCLVPLLLVYSITDRTQKRFSLALLIPIAVLLGYESFTYSLYGSTHFFDAISHTVRFEGNDEVAYWEQLCVALSFTGGAMPAVLFCLPWLLSGRDLAVPGIVAAIAAYAGAFHAPSIESVFHTQSGIEWSLVLQFVLFVFAGCIVVWITLQDFFRDRGRQSGLLVLWVLGVFAFAAIVNWAINGRTLLPLVPAAAIVVARRLERGSKGTATFQLRWPIAALVPALAIALLLNAADYQKAEVGRTAADEISEWCREQGRPVWFQGHWGFQWYMEHHGATAVDFRNPALPAGDLMVTPTDNANVFSPDTSLVKQVNVFEYEVPKFAAINCRQRGAGFYSHIWGPLPFSFGAGVPEIYYVDVILPSVNGP